MQQTFQTGFIGCGNMAAAIIEGIIQNEVLKPNQIYVFDTDIEKCKRFKGVNICADISELTAQSQLIFLCVKPNILPSVLSEINVADRCIVSIAAGVKIETMRKNLKVDAKLMRIMPNTPLMVGKGAVCIQTPNDFPKPQSDFIKNVFAPIAMVKEVREEDMDAVTGVSGSGPAYVYRFIDSVAKSGAAHGLSYETALELAIQTFEGACGMLKQSGQSPEQLISDVCSPGGTTLEAMNVFHERNIEHIIAEAVDACIRRSKELSGVE